MIIGLNGVHSIFLARSIRGDMDNRTGGIVVDPQDALGAIENGRVIFGAVIGPRGDHGADCAAAEAIDANRIVVYADEGA